METNIPLPTPVTPERRAARPQSRLVVLGSVYYKQASGPTSQVATTYAEMLASDEQVYQRQVTVGEEPAPIDSGWVKEASLLVVINEDKVLGNPGVLLCSGVVPFSRIPPGQHVRVPHPDLSSLRVRSLSGRVKCSIHLVPA